METFDLETQYNKMAFELHEIGKSGVVHKSFWALWNRMIDDEWNAYRRSQKMKEDVYELVKLLEYNSITTVLGDVVVYKKFNERTKINFWLQINDRTQYEVEK